MDIDELSDWSDDSDWVAAERDIDEMFSKAHNSKLNGGFNKVWGSQFQNNDGTEENKENKEKFSI